MNELLNLQSVASIEKSETAPALSITSCDSNSCNVEISYSHR